MKVNRQEEGPPESLVEVAAELYPQAWDRGWYPLIGGTKASAVVKCAGKGCDDLHLIPLKTIRTLKDEFFKVGQCPTCQNFLYFQV